MGDGPTGRVVILSIGIAMLVAACGLIPAPPTSTPVAEEQLPSFAGIWLTAAPEIPVRPVSFEVTSPDDPGFRRTHTFQAGSVLRGSVPVSAGRYHLAALDGGCVIDLTLGPEREMDVRLIVVADGTCRFVVTREHGDDVVHDEPSELVALSPATVRVVGWRRVAARELRFPQVGRPMRSSTALHLANDETGCPC
jgi:hypothetical protein